MNSLTILYTSNLRGDLQLLPRLYTFIQQLKREHDSQALLLDTGHACADDVWHCEATKGRSTVIVLDGMGYHAVNVADFMGNTERDSLAGSISTGLVTHRHMWRYFVPPTRDEDIVIAGQSTPAIKLCIVAAPSDKTVLENRTLHLKTLEKGQVGLVVADLQKMTIATDEIFTMPPKIKPDATIAASVDLVEEEARLAQKRND